MPRASVWDRIAEEYANKRYFGKRLEKREREILTALSADARSVLDVGCGCGRHVRFFRSLGKFVIGVDISLAMLRHARKKSNDNFVLASAHALPFRSRTFELVVCLGNTIGSLEGISKEGVANFYEICGAIREMIRVAKKRLTIEFRCKEKTVLEERRIFRECYSAYAFSVKDVERIMRKIKEGEERVMTCETIAGRRVSNGNFIYVVIELKE